MPNRTSQPTIDRPTSAQVARFDLVSPMLEAAHKEIGDLSKKKPDGPLNALKVRHINKLLKEVRDALAGDPSVEFLDLLDEEQLPLNSDAVLILAQYKAAASQFKSRHFGWDGDEHRWQVRDDH